MGQIEIKSMTLGMVATNCYLIINKENKEALLVDPADNALRISNVIEENGCTLKAILLTHGHFDHIMALNDLKKRYNVPVYAHEEEEDVLKQSSLNLSGSIGQIYTTQADVYVKDGEHLKLAGLDVIVLYTPGHTKCLLLFPRREGFDERRYAVPLFHRTYRFSDRKYVTACSLCERAVVCTAG